MLIFYEAIQTIFNTPKLAANIIRMHAVTVVQKANSEHPGMPMGATDCAFVLWNKFLRFNPEYPKWLNRDRFVLSAKHGSMLLYSLLQLFEYEISMDDLIKRILCYSIIVYSVLSVLAI